MSVLTIFIFAALAFSVSGQNSFLQECPEGYTSVIKWVDGAETVLGGLEPFVPDLEFSEGRSYSADNGEEFWGSFGDTPDPHVVVKDLPEHENLIWTYSLMIGGDWDGNTVSEDRFKVAFNKAARQDDALDWEEFYQTSVSDRGRNACFPYQCDDNNECIGGPENDDLHGSTGFDPEAGTGTGAEYLVNHTFAGHTLPFAGLRFDSRVQNIAEGFSITNLQVCLEFPEGVVPDTTGNGDDAESLTFGEFINTYGLYLIGGIALVVVVFALSSIWRAKIDGDQAFPPPAKAVTTTKVSKTATPAGGQKVDDDGSMRKEVKKERAGSERKKSGSGKRGHRRKGSHAKEERSRTGSGGKTRKRSDSAGRKKSGVGGSPTKGRGVSPSKVRFADMAKKEKDTKANVYETNSVAPPSEAPPPLPE